MVIEELKQKLIAKVPRYQGRVRQYISRTDCLSITDISCDGDAQKEQETSDADAPIAQIEIKVQEVKTQLKRIPSWKASGLI